jgi:hypothetical protein
MAANGIPTFAQFKRSLAGTPMSGEARGIYNAALRGNLNPAFVSGLASAESSYGTKGYARGRYNPYGLGVHLGWKFKNYSEATSRLAKTLSGLGYPSLYQRGGLSGVISQYTPASDGNDESAHARNIIAAGRRAGGDASRVYTRGASVPMQAPADTAPMAPIVQQETQGATGFQFDPAELIRQYQRSRSGEVTPEEMRQTTRKMARAAGSSFAKQAMGLNVNPFGERTPSPSVATSELATYSPTSFSVGGGPGQGTHSYSERGNIWQDDNAYDFFAKAGASVTNPYAGRVTNISGSPGGDARFAGYGVTVDYGGGRKAFYKHLGSLGRGVSMGAQLRPGAVIGGLDPATQGGPHLHLGATKLDFLEQLKKYYTTAKKR